MQTRLRLVVTTMLAFAALASPAAAQECKQEDVSTVIDSTGGRLREINSQWQPRLRAKLRELAQKNGWSEAEVETKGRAVIEDDETRSMDERAAALLADLDRLGDDDASRLPVCER